MKLREFLGLSEYDMNTIIYYMKMITLVEAIFLFLNWYIHHNVRNEVLFLFVIQPIYSLVMYFIGFITGIIIARSTVREYLESQGRINAITVVKPGSVNETDSILDVGFV